MACGQRKTSPVEIQGDAVADAVHSGQARQASRNGQPGQLMGEGEGKKCPPRQDFAYEVGQHGWARVIIGVRQISVVKETQAVLRRIRRTHWTSRDGLLVCPPLAAAAWQVAEG